MERVTYRLSNRQRKDLLVRDCEIYVAIPWWSADADATDCRQYVLDRLEGIEPHWLHAAEEMEILVYPRATGQAVDRLIGTIVDDAWPIDEGRIYITVVAIVATLRGPRVRRTDPAIKWPGDAILAGGRLLSDVLRSPSDP